MKSIPFRIIGLQVDNFQLFDSPIQFDKNFEVRTECKFGVNKAEHVVACNIIYEYVQHDNSYLKMSLRSIFDVQIDAFNDMFKDDKLVLQPYFSQYLAMINVGAARGEIHARCENAGSELANVILPPINLMEVLSESVVIE